MRFLMAVFAVLAFAAGGALAQGVDYEKSEIRFVSKLMGANAEGHFRKWKADVDFRPGEAAKARASVEVDLASIDFASEEVEREVRRPEWFDTARFPVAAFRSSAVKDLGGGRYEVAGALTLKGATHDVTVPMQMHKDAAGSTVAEGRFTIRRSAFGIGGGAWSDPSLVADEVNVRVRVVLR
ncbi:MAG: YceI family protein [Burkholderiales bacterium]|nr:YceI family protein [Burkholderiales bacterium]